MKIQTLSILSGTTLCNASCPYCISKMTPKQGINIKEPEVNWRNFDKACRLAQLGGVTNILVTGKGEPTLYPNQITKYLKFLQKFNFPIIELQTNALLFEKKDYQHYLEEWYNLGLTVIAISIVHYEKEKNAKIYAPNSEYISLDKVISQLHNLGFSVRLSCTMVKGYIDNISEVKKIIKKAREWKVEQLSLRELAKPLKSAGKEIYKWTKTNTINYKKIKEFIQKNSNKLLELGHGACIYDFNGQNVCLTNALTIEPTNETLRQIIFFPNGRVKFDWQFQGATLI